MIRTVIFDIDNTLYDFDGNNLFAIEVLADYACTHFGWEHDRFREEYRWAQDELPRVLGSYAGGVRSRLLRLQLILEKNDLPLHPHLLAMYDLYWNTLLERMEAFPGAAETMRELKARGVRIGIGTDMTARMQVKKLTRLDVLQYVDFMVTSEEAGEEKPGKVFFDRCLAKIRCAPQECLFVGDHPKKDIEGALKAGLQALWYDPRQKGGHDEFTRITDLKEVLTYCQRL